MDTFPQLRDGAQTGYFKAGGEWCFLRTPGTYAKLAGPIPCVIQCHGNSGYVHDGKHAMSTSDTLDEHGESIFIRSLADAGVAVAGSHATGSAWGRPAAVAAYAALFEALLEHSNVDHARMGMLGGGLGGAALWNAVTGPLAGRVRAACLQQAALSFESVVRNHKFKGALLTAYGIPEDTDDDLAVAALAYEDPLHRTQLLLAEKGAASADLLPEVLFAHGDEDENLLYRENPVALSEVLKACGAKFSFKTYHGVGHATYALGLPVARDIAEFFAATLFPQAPSAPMVHPSDA